MSPLLAAVLGQDRGAGMRPDGELGKRQGVGVLLWHGRGSPGLGDSDSPRRSLADSCRLRVPVWLVFTACGGG